MDMFAEDTRDYSPEQSEFVRAFPDRELVGAMLYLAMHTRQDVAYTVGVLLWQCKQPRRYAC